MWLVQNKNINIYLLHGIHCRDRNTAWKKTCLHWFPPSISCLIKQKEKMLQHHQRHINQAWKHNGENLTEGNPRQRQTHEILLTFIVPPSVFSTQLVCWPISGVDPKMTIKNHCLILSALPSSIYLSEGVHLMLPWGDHLSTLYTQFCLFQDHTGICL